MAATRLIPMHQNKGRSLRQCIADRTEYAKNGEKTEHGQYVTAYACDPKTVEEEFLLSKQEYLNITGRKPKGDIIAYQIRQSFTPGEISPEEANKVGYETAMRFTKGNHAFIVATHVDKAHIHNHIIYNSTTLSCDRKFRNFFLSFLALQRVSDLVCLEHGLSVIKPLPYGERDKRTVYPQRPSFRSNLRNQIDMILADSDIKDVDMFLTKLKDSGYEIKRGKHIAVRGGEQKRFIRLRSLGAGYTDEDIRSRVLKFEETKKPEEKKSWTRPKRDFDMLIDIQKKLAEGKGKGYERWAKLYNVKQVAKALMFLQDHGIRDDETLEQKTNAASDYFNELSASIKKQEKRLAEISDIRKHIVNYMRTKDVYAAYRKSGYSKKFLEEHRAEILLHKAAKQAFDKLQVKKLPTIKALNLEYAQVLDRKKKLYAEYRKAKKDMSDYQVAKHDIDQILNLDAEKKEQQRQKSRETTL
ncbi:relaxase/mobilization nuclease domain-containing protein [Butyrivibrio sp. INlla14]|uniref:relaxase/mobilization nuclease domain-containing protein n=1 Tax=Butyrivibrio sp. INlla14 TaxID=1520808 RepID=UPI0008765021|nr:relaxase/mobilization nuclease domain-containing protein [Butyrivibrio sp. INlla14]SCY11220.1 Relaxase/Mobilisation nuclease domain-containing protein [Butyrivibrio sp. INlla14]